MRWTTAGTEVSKVVVRPVMAVATRAKMPLVAWRRKSAKAAAPRINESRTTMSIPEEERRPLDEYWVVMLVRCSSWCSILEGTPPPPM